MDLTTRPSGSRRTFLLLAPAGAPLGPFSGPVTSDQATYSQLIGRMQRLRGRIYLNDGAIRATDLTHDGRHLSDLDDESWHLLTVDAEADNRVMGCARLNPHPYSVPFTELAVSRSALARSPEWGEKLRKSIEAEMDLARGANFFWLEMGGWALAEELRGTTEALLYALATYAWSLVMGGAIGITTATERNGSAAILKRLGGRPLEWRGAALPAYYDENYRCQMEVLRFDSREPNPKYAVTIEQLRCQISNVPVIGAPLAGNWKADMKDLHFPLGSPESWVAGPSNLSLATYPF